MNPGWYPDPYGDGTLRWWDGQTWTGFTAPMAPPGGFYRADPHDDLARVQRMSGRASLGVVLAAVLGVLNLAYFATVYANAYRTYFDQVDAFDNGTRTTLPTQPAGSGWTFLITLAVIGAQLLLQIWLLRAAQLARNAGLPAKRSPGWAIGGYFVPVVNFWFPYQVARDTLPAGDPRRRIVSLWWTWYLVSTLGSIGVAVVAIISETAGIVTALADAAAYLLAAVYGRRMIAAVTGSHEQLVKSLLVH